MQATRTSLIAPFALALALCACGGKDADATASGPAGEAPLPQPQQMPGAVTDMPTRPGPGEVPIGGEPPAPPPLFPADERFGMPALADNPETGLGDPSAFGDAATNEPATGDAVAVVQRYYAAIAARDFTQAHALWSDGGRGSGQTLEQFAAGFAQTASVQVQAGEPGMVEAAAGSRYVQVPVSVKSIQRDGSTRDYIGHYVLRRATVDGASAEQRAWRIASADLRELAQ